MTASNSTPVTLDALQQLADQVQDTRVSSNVRNAAAWECARQMPALIVELRSARRSKVAGRMMLTVQFQSGYGRDAPPAERMAVEVPDSAHCKWEPNQHTLMVIGRDGNHVAAFYGVRWFHTDSIDIR